MGASPIFENSEAGLVAMEQTLAIIKPDAMNLKVAEHIVQAVEAAGFFVVRMTDTSLTPARARDLYTKHEGQPGFRVLTEFMSSGPVKAIVLSKVGAVKAWMAMMGPEDPVQAREVAPGCLRALYGSDSVRNAVHGSESLEDARREIAILFPQGPLQSMVPREFLLETVLPGLVEALQEMYKQMPEDPYGWMAHWFGCSAPPPRDLLEDYPKPVMGQERRLRSDRFPGIHDRRLGEPLYEGTWNFRRITDRDPVYGTGQSDAIGVKMVAEGLRRSGHHHIVWVNLRDDAFFYFSGRSISTVQSEDGWARELGQYQHRVRSLNGFQLERMEGRLKVEVGMHARGRGGTVQLELTPSELRALPVGAEPPEYQANEDEMLTLKEVFKATDMQGATFDFHRIPLPYDSAPPEYGVDRLVEAVRHVDVSAALVFQCTTGVDRTTTGMVMAALVWRARSGMDHSRIVEVEYDPENPDWANGEWMCVMDIVDSLEARDRPGRIAKQKLDEAIDKCGGLLNLRQEPLICLQKAQHCLVPPEGMEPLEEGIDHWMRRGLRSLERYMWLLLFAIYAVEESPGGFQRRFSTWIRSNMDLIPAQHQISLA